MNSHRETCRANEDWMLYCSQAHSLSESARGSFIHVDHPTGSQKRISFRRLAPSRADDRSENPPPVPPEGLVDG
ncbi:unnamed protein product [Phytophthora fragariaefolia]|uniref:Unnamed protein product n=1 Tax=Phytophthora fragariaefolia TaxID=1490495 RepID=A0A9W6Y951_9STRA|nr:unnamed protein product [Phytophthora fragariaefolia]